MPKTTLTLVTAGLLALLSLTLIISRRQALGNEIAGTPGDSVWQVTVVSEGELARQDSTITTQLTPDFRQQHVQEEAFASKELIHRIQTCKDGGARKAIWRWRPGVVGNKAVRIEYSFRCILGTRRPTAGMMQRSHTLDAAPHPQGPELRKAALIESDAPEILTRAEMLAEADADEEERAQACFDFVRSLPSGEATTALTSLQSGAATNDGKCRLLVALCRALRLPARQVNGILLRNSGSQQLHRWAEVWLKGHWLPMDPNSGHFGLSGFPRDYLVIYFGDDPARVEGGRLQTTYAATDLHFSTTAEAAAPPSATKRFWRKMSLSQLRPEEEGWVRFLLLLPLGALAVCVCRTVIGVTTYGTFGPALLGLVCRDLSDFPWVMASFITILMVGWGVRLLLDRYHLLMVPRLSAVMTVVVVLLLLALMLLAPYAGATHGFVGLLPLIILIHMIERFWTVETEDGAGSSFKTLLGTIGVVTFITFLVHVDVVLNGLLRPLGVPAAVPTDVVSSTLFLYPEVLGLVLAAQLVLGRYTGYRLTELFRFQDMIQEFPTETSHEPAPAHLEAVHNGHPRDEPPQHRLHSGPQPAAVLPGSGQQKTDV